MDQVEAAALADKLYRKYVGKGAIDLERLYNVVLREKRAAEEGRIQVSQDLLRELRVDVRKVRSLLNRPHLDHLRGLGGTPVWPGASQAYSHLYKVLEKMGAANYKAAVSAAKKRGVKVRPPQPTEEMKEIMEALDAGDEERIKGLKLRYLNEGFGDLPSWVR